MPKIEPKVAAWVVDFADDLPNEIKGLCLRVNLNVDKITTESNIKTILEKYGHASSPFLCVHELGDTSNDPEGNPHYHCFFCTAGTIKAVRSAVAKIWRGNEAYSLKKATTKLVPEHFNYLCKGTGTGSDDYPDVVYRSDDFTDERITELHGLYWSNNDAFKANSKKRKALSIDEQVFDLCRHLKPPIDRRDIYRIIRDFYGKRTKKWRLPYIRDLVFQTQMYLEPLDSDANQFSETFCTGLPVRPDQ